MYNMIISCALRNAHYDQKKHFGGDECTTENDFYIYHHHRHRRRRRHRHHHRHHHLNSMIKR